MEGVAAATNESLIRICNWLGTTRSEEITKGGAVDDLSVYLVEEKGGGVKDELGELILSTTSQAFPLHTDGFARRCPYDLVVLLCVRAAASGGESVLSSLSHVLPRLSASARDELQQEQFPCCYGKTSIIYGSGNHINIRYNSLELRSQQHHQNACLTERASHAVLELDEALEWKNAQYIFQMKFGNCLILDNHRVLHGRLPFSSGSQRLLKRVRLYRHQQSIPEERG
jgi:alpha-ketoglutarate-dependent taurine dioxygenase